MKAFGIALAVLALTSPANAEEVRRVSETEFARVLQGCWGAEWTASMVGGGYAGGTDLLCFDADGNVSTESYMFGDVRGRYILAEQKLHLATDSAPNGWLLGGTEMSCDAAIRRGEGLTLTGCRGNAIGRDGTVGPVEDLPDQWYFVVAESDR